MHWELSDEQELFATSLREWIEARFPTETMREMQSDGGSDKFTRALVDEGWWGVGYPEDAGGEGGGPLELALAAREFGRSAAPDSSWLAAALVAPLLSAEELATQLEGGEKFALVVRADRIPRTDSLNSDGTTVTGTARHVLGAGDATVLIVPVETTEGVGLARVAATAASITPENVLDRSRAVATVAFAEAPIDHIASASESALAKSVALAAVLVSADALGSAERMLELSVTYSKQRQQFGQYIGSFQAVKHAAAEMLVTVEASYSIALYAAAALDAGLESADTVAAVAKAQVANRVAALADSALTVHGAIGYTWEHDLHLFYKRAKLARALFGAPSVWNERVAAGLLGSQSTTPSV